MAATRFFRSLILGNQFIPNRTDFKRIMLTGYLAILCVVANLLYVVLASREGHANLSWLNVTFSVFSIIAIILLRLRYYTVAKFTLFLGAYLVIFIFCAIEPVGTAVSFFLILINLAATALFGINQWKYALSLTILGSILFIWVYIVGFHLVSPAFSEHYVMDNFIMNFFVFLVLAMLIVYFILELNHFAEKNLEKKETEAIVKNQELTKLNAELDRFVYSVSHDLRSPLASIAGLTYIGQHVENLEEAKQYFSMIDDRIKAQDFFIREIIDFYRNSRTGTQLEKISVRKQVEEIEREQAMNFGSIVCRIEIPEEFEVISDKIRLKSVMSNLMGNAIKYHDPAKSDRFIQVTAETSNTHWIIAVKDNGLGIGQGPLEKVFDMFYRASADSKGSGLGLFIARETVEKLGGKISVESALGRGSCFSVALPIQQPLHNLPE